MPLLLMTHSSTGRPVSHFSNAKMNISMYMNIVFEVQREGY